MVEDTLLVLGDERIAADVENAFGRAADVSVRALADLDRLFDVLCFDVVSGLLLPAEFDGASGLDVARGVRGLYPDLPVLVAGIAEETADEDGETVVEDGETADEVGATIEDGATVEERETVEEGIDSGTADETDGFERAGVATVATTDLTDERVVETMAEMLEADVDTAAARPPSRLETLAMSMFDGFDDHLYAKDAAARHVLTDGETLGLDTVVGRTDRVIDDGVAEDRRPSLVDDEEVLSSGEPVVGREEYVDGESAHTLTTKVPWYDADGSVVGLVGISKDISNRKSQERALRQQNERLAKIAVVAAHELRNELQVATGRLPHLPEDPSQLEVVADSLDHLETIVDDVVKLATAERRAVDETSEWLSASARGVWETLDTGDAVLDVTADRLVVADPEAFRLFFEIMLSNAVEHGGSDVTVTVGSTENGFFVADDGTGIALDPPERVFDAGFASTDADAGFGLYIAQRIAADHGWTLGVSEGPDGGARFDVNGVDGP